MALCRFVKYTILQFLPLIKDLSGEELHQLILTLNIPTLMTGLKYANLKEMSIDNRSTCINALLLAISLCEDLKVVIVRQGPSGVNCYKNVRLLENHISFLKEIQIKIIHKRTSKMH